MDWDADLDLAFAGTEALSESVEVISFHHFSSSTSSTDVDATLGASSFHYSFRVTDDPFLYLPRNF